jgi:hypothetical protein
MEAEMHLLVKVWMDILQGPMDLLENAEGAARA